MSVRLAVVGSGYMATEYIRAAEYVTNLEVIGICSRNLQTAQTLALESGIPFITTDLYDLVLSTCPDVILVCVPELSTEQVLTQLMEFRIPIVAEKPIGLSLSQAKRIEDLAIKAECSIYVALNRRFYSATEQALIEIEAVNGKRFIRVIDQVNQVSARNSGQPDQVVKNWMFANSIHIIDYIQFLARGTVVKVENKKPFVADAAQIITSQIEFSSGDVALYTCYWNMPARWSVDVSIGEKTWQFSPLEKARVYTLQNREFREFETSSFDHDFKPGLFRILQEIESLVSVGESKLTNLSVGNLTMELIEGIYNV